MEARPKKIRKEKENETWSYRIAKCWQKHVI